MPSRNGCVLVIDVFVLKEVSLKELPRVMRESMVLVGGILVILGVSLASTNYMIDAGVPQQLLAWISNYVNSQLGFLFLLLVFLLILGAILDIFSAIVLVVPLILPIAVQFGVHPVHLSIVFLATMQLCYITPPIGLNLFIASYRFERSITTLYVSTLPWFLFLMISVLIIAARARLPHTIATTRNFYSLQIRADVHHCGQSQASVN